MIGLAALVALVLCLGGYGAQAWLISKPPAVAAYEGPGDLASFTAWWGLRAYSAAVAATGTQPAADLRRASDSATCTVLIATDGTLDVAVGTPCAGQTVTAWIGASTALVSKLYDQTGGNACGGSSCDLAQATTTKQPTLFVTGGGGAGTLSYLQTGPALFDGRLISANNFTGHANAQQSLSAVGNRPGGSSTMFFMNSTNAGGGGSGNYISSIGAASWSLTGVQGSAANAAWHASNGIINNTVGASVHNVDGTETTGTVSVSTTAGKPQVIDEIATFSTIQLAEAGFQDNAQWSGTLRTSLCHNQRLYWGTGGSC